MSDTVRWVRTGRAALLVCAWLVACGRTAHDGQGESAAVAGDTMTAPDQDGSDEAPSGVGAAPGGDGVGTSGSVSVGAGGRGGSGGSPGSAPVVTRWPLIVGKGSCPALAPATPSCGGVTASCIYPGINQRPTDVDSEVRCDCVGTEWACIVTRDRFQTVCPVVPYQQLRGREPCPAEPGSSCEYVVPGSPWGASCRCESGGFGAPPGEAGAGGAPTFDWHCYL